MHIKLKVFIVAAWKKVYERVVSGPLPKASSDESILLFKGPDFSSGLIDLPMCLTASKGMKTRRTGCKKTQW